jgi:hypothetical protein
MGYFSIRVRTYTCQTRRMLGTSKRTSVQHQGSDEHQEITQPILKGFQG